MLDELFRALIASKNEAADEVLVDAMRVGTPGEQTLVLGALLARKSVRGLTGAIGLYESMPPRVRAEMLANARAFHAAIREAGRGAGRARRGAIAMIADGRQGKLAYVLGESLRGGDESNARAAAVAMTSLARWIADAIASLQADACEATEPPLIADADDDDVSATPTDAIVDDFSDPAATYKLILENRGDVEAAIVRGLELHHGSIGQDLLDAATLLADHAQSPALHAMAMHARVPALRRLRQRPIATASAVPAFLLGAARGPLRAGFAAAVAAIEASAALSAVARRAHWLGDHLLHGCARGATEGVWLDEASLAADLSHRAAIELPGVARWIGASGLDDKMQDARLAQVMAACGPADAASRLAVLRVAIGRPRSAIGTLPASLDLLKQAIRDPDASIARLAVRDLIRRRPADLESIMLPLMATAPDGVRRLIGRAVGARGFETYWTRFDQMDRATRRTAGRAIVRLLPDALARLGKRLSSGAADQRLKALQIAAELEVIEPLKQHVLPLCAHGSPRVRSKAVTVLGQIGVAAIDPLLERVMNDEDARVRANAVEAMESRPAGIRFVPLLTERARDGANRERANAIKALHQMKVETAASQLLHMLRDPRAEHRISAMWALRKIGWWRMLNEVARIAREDDNLRARQYAMGVLQVAAGEQGDGTTRGGLSVAGGSRFGRTAAAHRTVAPRGFARSLRLRLEAWHPCGRGLLDSISTGDDGANANDLARLVDRHGRRDHARPDRRRRTAGGGRRRRADARRRARGDAGAAAPWDDIFRSMQTSAERPALDIATHLVPLGVGAVGFVGAMIALAHWNRVRASRPKPVGDHRSC